MIINVHTFNANDIYYRMTGSFTLDCDIANDPELVMDCYLNACENVGFDPLEYERRRGCNSSFFGISPSTGSRDEIDLILVFASTGEIAESIMQMLSDKIAYWVSRGNEGSKLSECPLIPIWETEEYARFMDRAETGDAAASDALVTLGELVIRDGYYPPIKSAA